MSGCYFVDSTWSVGELGGSHYPGIHCNFHSYLSALESIAQEASGPSWVLRRYCLAARCPACMFQGWGLNWMHVISPHYFRGNILQGPVSSYIAPSRLASLPSPLAFVLHSFTSSFMSFCPVSLFLHPSYYTFFLSYLNLPLARFFSFSHCSRSFPSHVPSSQKPWIPSLLLCPPVSFLPVWPSLSNVFLPRSFAVANTLCRIVCGDGNYPVSYDVYLDPRRCYWRGDFIFKHTLTQTRILAN